MSVPEEVLDQLRCSKCESYLSRGPIYLQHNGVAVCGRCFTSKIPATRNTQYEALARLVRFPCKNRDLGCPTTVSFAEEAQDIAHEEICKHRQYVCPVLGSACCDWLGTIGEMLQHCQEQHHDHVLDNPCSLVHNITKSSLHNYLVTAFQLLFLLHTKVCVTTGKIYHAIRFLGSSDKAPEFNYALEIKRKNELFLKEGHVVGQGCLGIQEDMSLAVNTNSLLDMLGGGDGITFTLTLKRQESLLKTCTKCDALVTMLEYRNEDGWYCNKCAPDKQNCKNHDIGCRYNDFKEKCVKHQLNFCAMKTICEVCKSSIPRGTLFSHYYTAHSNLTYKTGFKWRFTPQKNWRSDIMQSVAGVVICWYVLGNLTVSFHVYSLITNDRLHEYKCTARVIQPSTGREKTFTPEACYNTQYDWEIYITKEHFPIWSQEFDIIVDISKTVE